MTTSSLQLFTIYNKNTLDYPGYFIARQFNGAVPTDIFFKSTDYLEVIDWVLDESAKLKQGSPVCIQRHPSDDPNIIETWF